MGCLSSKQTPPGSYRGRHYDSISAEIITHSPEGPSDAIRGLLASAGREDLKPKDPGKLPLLALALDNDQWFRWVSVGQIYFLFFKSYAMHVVHAPRYPIWLFCGVVRLRLYHWCLLDPSPLNTPSRGTRNWKSPPSL